MTTGNTIIQRTILGDSFMASPILPEPGVAAAYV